MNRLSDQDKNRIIEYLKQNCLYEVLSLDLINKTISHIHTMLYADYPGTIVAYAPFYMNSNIFPIIILLKNNDIGDFKRYQIVIYPKQSQTKETEITIY